MRRQLLNILRCPACLNKLRLTNEKKINGIIISGDLICNDCKSRFPIHRGIPLFGVSQKNYELKKRTVDGEKFWTHTQVSDMIHLDYLRSYVKETNDLIGTIEKKCSVKNPLVLDLGAGSCEVSYQFSKHNFNVIATDLVSEFLLSSDILVNDQYFERVASDVETLPFAQGTYDIVFCKEILHHIENLQTVLSEIHRVTKKGGILIFMEPTWPSLLPFKHILNSSKADQEKGIYHYYYTYYDYLKAISRISTEIHIACRRRKIKNIFSPPKVFEPIFTKFLIGGGIVVNARRDNREAMFDRIKRNFVNIDINDINVKMIKDSRKKMFKELQILKQNTT